MLSTLLNPVSHVSVYEDSNSEKITRIQHCSDCCMECNTDGTPNIVGRIHQASLTRTLSDGYTYLDCKRCHVFQGIPEDEWNLMLAEIDGSE